MIERIEGIVTEIVKHNDKHNVVTLYTRTRGRMAFLVPVGKSKNGRLRNAVIQPMAVVAAEVNIRGGKELYTLRQPTPLRLWHNIYSNPLKSSILFFITEFCNRLLRQYPADELMWEFLLQSLDYLEEARSQKISNFHIAFLIRMSSLAGIEPPARNWEKGDQFDMLTGEMTDRENPEFLRRRILLPEDESSVVPGILRMNLRNMHCFRFTREQRNRLLNRILEYYSVHLSINREYKTLDVLREMFD